MAFRGRRVALLAALPCAAVLGILAYLLEDHVEDWWYIHRIEAGNPEEVERYGATLRNIAGVRTIPQLRWLLQRKKALILEGRTGLSQVFFETMTAIGREGVAAVILNLGEEERILARKLWPAGEVVGGTAFLACLGHPKEVVRLEALRILASHEKGGFQQSAFPPLLGLLDDPYPQPRREALWLLAGYLPGNPAVRRELRAGLRDGDSATRGETIRVLPYARLALPELIGALKDPDQGVRGMVVRALGFSDCEEALPPLTAALKDPGLFRVAVAALGLGNLADSVSPDTPAAASAIAALLERLPSASSEDLVLTLSALGQFGPAARAAVPAAMEVLGRDFEGQVAAAEALSRMGSAAARAVTALTGILSDPKEKRGLREKAAEALASIGSFPPETCEAIVQAVRETDLTGAAFALGAATAHSEPLFREAIAILEGKGSCETCNAALIQGLCSAKGRLKAALPVLMRFASGRATRGLLGPIADALGELGPDASEAIPFLRQAVAEAQDPFNSVAIALWRIDRNETSLVVRSAIERMKEDPWRAMRVFRALGPDAAGAVPAILQHLKDERKALRAYPVANPHARTLAAIGRPAVGALVEALADEDVILRSLAAQTLGRIGAEAQAALPALEKALADPDDEVRREAAKALRKIRANP